MQRQKQTAISSMLSAVAFISVLAVVLVDNNTRTNYLFNRNLPKPNEANSSKVDFSKSSSIRKKISLKQQAPVII